MHKLLFDQLSLRTVLCLGAHCDDIEIGCGGALLELRARYPKLQFHWVVFTTEGEREAETRAAAQRISEGTGCTVDIERFQGSYLHYAGPPLKDRFESLKSRVSPDLIFTHRLEDRHQDHRVLAELTWNTWRNHLILEYEIPKYEGDLGHPNVYVPVATERVDRKVDILTSCFASQAHRAWFTADLFRGLMRLRGVECNSASGFAEAFYARKLVL
jgi:LmbE family N-acetylglucosaminyl deacetylase